MAVTKTLKASGGDFSLISAWEAWAQSAYNATEAYNLEIYNGDYGGTGGALSDSVNIDGWIDPTATYPVSIYPATASDGHQGVVGDGFKITGNNNFVVTFRIREPHFKVWGFSADTTKGVAVIEIDTATGGAGGVEIHDMIVTTDDINTETQYGVAFRSGGVLTVPTIVYNILAIDCASGVYSYSARNLKCYNVTAIDCNYGFNINSSGSGTDVRNCIAFGSATSDWNMAGTNSGTYTNNASGDTAAPGTAEQTGVTTSDFVDYAGGDYTPTSTGKLADPAATDLSEFFDDDITGALR